MRCQLETSISNEDDTVCGVLPRRSRVRIRFRDEGHLVRSVIRMSVDIIPRDLYRMDFRSEKGIGRNGLMLESGDGARNIDIALLGGRCR